eukprot:365160-Chlamydomonas_euryale.AAC.6
MAAPPRGRHPSLRASRRRARSPWVLHPSLRNRDTAHVPVVAHSLAVDNGNDAAPFVRGRRARGDARGAACDAACQYGGACAQAAR